MAIRAVALVHIDPSRVKVALDPGPAEERAKLKDDRMDVVEGADGNVYFIEAFEDATAIRMGFALGHAEPEVMGTLVAAALGDLVDEHDDPRGIPLFPETYRPKARSWSALLDEIGEALDWAPIEGTEVMDAGFDMGALQQGDLMSMVAQMQAQMSPQMLEQAMQMAQRLAEGGGMDELQRAMQQMMPDMSSLQGMPMDMEAMARQAQQMLEADPELQQRLAGQLGITDAVLDDDPGSEDDKPHK
ncbi:MAG: hypothetical protein CVU63_05680 [Deltaproteobacteria bacterium HGW-Deltaproteobacteria-20]|jgi:hypothetical protein|nr:MAG: hypothetical protein CVU63_05680 [Deltaproteobacteria bacterium HGW-Deltaproteobacteria-20]